MLFPAIHKGEVANLRMLDNALKYGHEQVEADFVGRH